ncbi:MAG: ATP-dependent Clp protease proteolytic subunit [Hyphomicrobium sp.]|nr:ATP-dependent Clp protease proteolytic subunit [Hyphomicrobium sp.]
MPSRTLNRVIWIAMLVLLAVLGFKTRDNIELLFAGVGKLDVRVVPDQDTVVLEWRGQIEAPMASRLAEAYEQHRRDAGKFVLSLSSPGGSLDQGAEVIRLLRRIAATHTLETIVEGRRLCASMCVPVYLQGQKRTASETSQFMFHEVRFREFHSDETIDVPDSATGKATDRLFRKYFLTAGVPAAWIRSVRAEMTGGVDVWKTGRELVDEKAGIVQDVF